MTRGNNDGPYITDCSAWRHKFYFYVHASDTRPVNCASACICNLGKRTIHTSDD